ncbi:TIM barrel protein, partial [Burkholderia pseudomallei]
RALPGFVRHRHDDAQAICREVGAPNQLVQFDCYHCQLVEGDLAMKLKRDIAVIGHIQNAAVPQRHEPDVGEIHYPY